MFNVSVKRGDGSSHANCCVLCKHNNTTWQSAQSEQFPLLSTDGYRSVLYKWEQHCILIALLNKLHQNPKGFVENCNCLFSRQGTNASALTYCSDNFPPLMAVRYSRLMFCLCNHLLHTLMSLGCIQMYPSSLRTFMQHELFEGVFSWLRVWQGITKDFPVWLLISFLF